jgi:hypothetical protein
MILVSINPFPLKKMFLLVAALLGLSSAICLADPLFMSTRFAFRGHQSRRFSPTILSATGKTEQPFFASDKGMFRDSTFHWATCRSE